MILTVLIDSWAWIEYFRGSEKGKKVIPIIEDGDEIIISPINLAEIYYTTLKKMGRDIAKRQKDAMERRCRVVDVDADVATKGAEIKLERRWGLADSIILATAQIEDATILTGDPHFRGVPMVEFLGD